MTLIDTTPVQHTHSLPEFDAASLMLGLAAQTLDDLETVRIASANRLRSLTRTEEDSDGAVRGLGLDASNPDVMTAMTALAGIEALEKQAVKSLETQMRKHPLGAFISAQKGVGLKTGARLLAAVGDPYWKSMHVTHEDGTVEEIERPRTVSELWSYCGYSVENGAAISRKKGVRSNWNAEAKKRTWIITSAAAKFIGSPLDLMQREYKAKHADDVHATDCVRCGPSGKPALAGSPLSAGHLHARAIRFSSKELLRQLWIETKKFYDDPSLLEEVRERAAHVDKLTVRAQERAANVGVIQEAVAIVHQDDAETIDSVRDPEPVQHQIPESLIRLAKSKGLKIRRSRVRLPESPLFSTFRIEDASTGDVLIEAPGGYGLRLDTVNEYVRSR